MRLLGPYEWDYLQMVADCPASARESLAFTEEVRSTVSGLGFDILASCVNLEHSYSHGRLAFITDAWRLVVDMCPEDRDCDVPLHAPAVVVVSVYANVSYSEVGSIVFLGAVVFDSLISSLVAVADFVSRDPRDVRSSYYPNEWVSEMFVGWRLWYAREYPDGPDDEGRWDLPDIAT